MEMRCKNHYPVNCSLHVQFSHPDKPGTAIANKYKFTHFNTKTSTCRIESPPESP